ncbi:MAG: type II toxin-antitoxin system VapC family toxin [Opitutus sp.]
MPALFDTGALELLRRRYRRVESLALKNYPPVVCSHVVGEYIHAQFQTQASDATVIAARLFLAPFEMLAQTSLTPDLFAQVRARLLAEDFSAPDAICWIAAHALEQQLPVVTTDRHFRHVAGLRVHLVKVPQELTGQEKRCPALAGHL